MKKLILAFAVFFGLATPAAARVSLVNASPGYTFFNRPGADLATHNAELRACTEQAEKTQQPKSNAGGTAGMGVGVAIFAASMAQGYNELSAGLGFEANVENCMIVYGWRVIGLSKDDGRAFDKLPKELQAARLSEWVGAKEPTGFVMRQFGNDAATSGSERLEVVKLFDSYPLSLRMLDPAPVPERNAVAWIGLRTPKSATPPKPANVKALEGRAADKAIVTVRVRGRFVDKGAALIFERVGADGLKPAWVSDGQPSTFVATVPSFVPGKTGTMPEKAYAFEIPPGRWRLSAIRKWNLNMSFCLGAPAFDIRAGQVIHAGFFDFTAPRHGPNMNLDVARAILASAPDLAAKVEPAAWTNGTTGECAGSTIYALEVEGAPFAAGYVGGSAH